MAPRRSNTNLASISEPLSAEETAIMDADRDAEHSLPEPEPVVEAAPEAPAAQPELALEDEHEDDTPPDPSQPQRKVDYGALHAERQKRKASDAELAKAKEQIATFNGRWETLQQLARGQGGPQATQPQEIEVPDINLDPVGHFEAKDRIRDRELSELRQWKSAQESQQTEYNNVSRLTQIAVSHEQEFSKKEPGYQEAAAWVRSARDQELQYMGYADPAQRQQIINQDALQIAAQALQGNMNAAEVVFNIAKARGWQAKPVSTSPPAPVPAAQAPDAKKIATVARGQEAGQSLGQVNGSAPAEVGIEAVLKMSDKDFAKWATEENFRKMAGG